MLNSCEACHKTELELPPGTLKPVLIDDNMETHLCGPCIDEVSTEVDVLILEED